MSENKVNAPSLPPLSITLFGPLSVQVHGEPLPKLRSRKAHWLLALLVLRHGRPVEREWLAGTLWPDVDQTQAFANMRPTLCELRKALGKEKERLQSPSRHALFLDLADAEVDLIHFDRAFVRETSAGFQHAVSLYRGSLLEGCTEDWVFAERERREQECLRALQTLGDAGRNAQEYAEAIGYYQRAIVLDPFRETARRSLMETLTQKGDRNTALEVYRDYLELLRETPQMAPDEETRALYNRLRAEASQQVTPRAGTLSAASVPTVTGYIPHALTDVIGREEECIEIADCLRQSRLVTLTGMGGIGKTRLAIAVAHNFTSEYPDGVWLVALEALSEGPQIFTQLASLLGVKETAGQSLSTSVMGHLKIKQLLLVLDNCEHLLIPCAETVTQLLTECAKVRILATSREALGITGEAIWSVPSLPTPDPARLPDRQATLLQILIGYESVQLFVERAEVVQKTFTLTKNNASAVASICFQLEGIPLALELAAALVRTMPVEQIAARLNDHLGLLTGGSRTAQARQKTLRATLEWSYALLTEAERKLLMRLSVFVGGWTLEAAESVCADDEASDAPAVLPLLTALADKSLVTFSEREAGTGGRFRMLEMVRQFASERLAASGNASRLMARHQDWFVDLAEKADPQLRKAEQAQWMRILASDYDNLRAIFARSEQGICSGEKALRLAGVLQFYWRERGDYSEGIKYLAQVLEHRDAQAKTPARAKMLNALGTMVRHQGEYIAAQTLFEESIAIYRELGDDTYAAEVMGNLGVIQQDLGNYTAAWAYYEECLSIRRRLKQRRGVALMLLNLGSMALTQGEFTRARYLVEESLLIYKAMGDVAKIAWGLNFLGSVMVGMGDLLQAQALHEESFAHLKEVGDKNGIAWTRNYQGLIASRQEDHTLAQALHEEALALFRDMGEASGITISLQYLGDTAFEQGNFELALSLYEESLSMAKERRMNREIAWCFSKLGTVAFSRSDRATGEMLFKQCLPLFKDMGDKLGIVTTLRVLASAIQMPDIDVAISLWGAAQTLLANIGAVMSPQDQAKYEQELSQARATLGEAAFVASWETGCALTWEQAADYALEKLETV
jgi:predicted ATPase/DNA-binding SARP family transcriptional activator